MPKHSTPRKRVPKKKKKIAAEGAGLSRTTRVFGIGFCAAILIFCFGRLIYGLYDIQIVNGEYYRQLAVAQQTKDTPLQAVRGEIYDATGKLLASTSIVWDISCDPSHSTGLYTTAEGSDEKILNESICMEASAGIARILVANDGSLGETVDTAGPEFQAQYEYIYARLSAIDKQYRALAGKVDLPVANRVKEYIADFNKAHTNKEENKKVSISVSISRTYKRSYPYGAFAASVIGFCNDDGEGVYGLEKSYNTELTGVNGRLITIKNAYGDEVNNSEAITYAAQDGYTLQLTLHAEIQEIAERYLEEAIKANKVENRGCAIVMNPKTGAVYGMAIKPDFDPNQPYLVLDEAYFSELVHAEPELYAHYAVNEEGVYYTDNLGNKIFDENYDYTGTYREIQWKNKALTELYYPGSVFKVFTGAAAVDAGLANYNTAYNCSGYYQVADHTYHCAGRKSHGAQNLGTALRNSCNIYFIQMGQSLGAANFYDYFNGFGFTQPTGIDLPYETTYMQYYNANRLGDTELASSAFGQAMAVTPMQVCAGISACVNGGYLVTPHLVEQILDGAGNVVKKQEPAVKRQVISETSSAIIREAMEYEVGNGSTTGGGANAYVAGYRIGGKSGTSEQLNMDKRADGDYKKVASFVAVLPADDPELLVYVMLDDPNNAKTDYSSILAAPVVGNIISEVAPYLGIATDGTDLTKTTVKVPNLIGTEWSNAQVGLNRAGLKHRLVENNVDNTAAPVTYQYPAPKTEVPGGTTVYIYTNGQSSKKVTVPGVLEKNAAFARQMLSAAGLNCIVTGDAGGVVVEQSVQPGTEVEMGTVVTVVCAQVAEPAAAEPEASGGDES